MVEITVFSNCNRLTDESSTRCSLLKLLERLNSALQRSALLFHLSASSQKLTQRWERWQNTFIQMAWGLCKELVLIQMFWIADDMSSPWISEAKC